MSICHQLYKSMLIGNNLKMSPDAHFLSCAFYSYRSNKLLHCNLKGLSTEIYRWATYIYCSYLQYEQLRIFSVSTSQNLLLNYYFRVNIDIFFYRNYIQENKPCRSMFLVFCSFTRTRHGKGTQNKSANFCYVPSSSIKDKPQKKSDLQIHTFSDELTIKRFIIFAGDGRST
jgi:hypothetical protein